MTSDVPTSTIFNRGLVAAVVVLMITATGCGSSDSESTTSASATTAVAATTTTAEPATTTPTTVAPTTTTAASPGVELPEPGEPWDLLFIAHGRAMGDAIPQLYAERAEQDLGVDINLHYPSGLHNYASEVLGHLGGGRYPDLSDLISQAEIIVIQTRPEHSDPGNETDIDTDSENCATSISATDPQPPAPTAADYWQPYRDLLDAIYTEIWTLRDGVPTVLIATDIHNPFLSEQRNAGIEAECRTWLEAWSDVDAAAAADHGGAVVSIHDVLNGSSHDVDPVEMGYLGPSEQYPALLWVTPNEVAAGMVSEALAAVGFEPRPMP